MIEMIKLRDVEMEYIIYEQKVDSLKEYILKKFSKGNKHRKIKAVNGVSLDIPKGDILGILGLNGSGKSTLLKLISGIIRPTNGSVEIMGTIAPLIELGSGFDMELTARENIYLNGAVLGHSKKVMDRNFHDIVEFSELEEFLDVPMKNYSSGMVARIAFAIATMVSAEILIVDEILSVGDYKFQQKCEKRINGLMVGGTTIIIVSHSTEQIKRLCKHAMWLEHGVVRSIGDAGSICDLYSQA